jgi:hypothetical protein
MIVPLNEKMDFRAFSYQDIYIKKRAIFFLTSDEYEGLSCVGFYRFKGLKLTDMATYFNIKGCN